MMGNTFKTFDTVEIHYNYINSVKTERVIMTMSLDNSYHIYNPKSHSFHSMTIINMYRCRIVLIEKYDSRLNLLNDVLKALDKKGK